MTGRYRNPSIDHSVSSTSDGNKSANTQTKNNNRPRSNSYQQHRPRSNSTSSYSSHHHHHHHGPRKPQSKKDLWKGDIKKDIGDGIIVQMVGMESSNHIVYARVDPSCNASPESLALVPINKVIEIMVTEGWRHVATDILTTGIHVETSDQFPSASELLHLGSVWILNETSYAAGDNYHAKRLTPKDEGLIPNWVDMTLRVHYFPDRFFVAHEVDWTKYCKGLLLDNCTSAVIGGKKAHVPVVGLPDGKDGVIVYEDNDIGFTVLNKPGGMPCHSSLSNHAEDVQSMFSAALKKRHRDESKGSFLSIPLRVEPETSGLILAATKKEFCSYTTKQLEAASKADDAVLHGEADPNNVKDITKTYRCLVCIREPNDIDRIEKMVNRTIVHHVDVRSPTPKTFVRNQPKHSNHEWAECQLRIINVGGQSSNYRAACVSSKYSDSNDFTLAHRLWSPDKEHPAEDLGVQYVMQVDVQLLNAKARPHQIRGQLAALGIPIVGDEAYGGGVCEMRMHKHLWCRMAVQICHLEFALPTWESVAEEEEEEDGGGEEEKKASSVTKALIPSKEDKCVFHLNTAWWSEYLVDYERFLVSGASDE